MLLLKQLDVLIAGKNICNVRNLLKSQITNLLYNSFNKRGAKVKYLHYKVTRMERALYTYDQYPGINDDADNVYTAYKISRMADVSLLREGIVLLY